MNGDRIDDADPGDLVRLRYACWDEEPEDVVALWLGLVRKAAVDPGYVSDGWYASVFVIRSLGLSGSADGPRLVPLGWIHHRQVLARITDAGPEPGVP